MLNAALLENDIYSSGTKKKSKGSTIYERNKVKKNFGKNVFFVWGYTRKSYVPCYILKYDIKYGDDC